MSAMTDRPTTIPSDVAPLFCSGLMRDSDYNFDDDGDGDDDGDSDNDDD